MKIEVSKIDVHNHAIHKKYVQMLADKGIGAALGVAFPNWDPESTIKLMDENGIATAITSVGAPGVYFKPLPDALDFARMLARETNELSADLVRSYPTRFGAFATLPLPDIDSALKELEYALDVLKMDGVWLLTSYEGRYLGDPYYDDLLFELNRRKCTVYFHPTVPPGLDCSHWMLPPACMDVPLDTARTAVSLMINGTMDRYGDINFILSHGGGILPIVAGRLSLTLQMIPTIEIKMVKDIYYYLNRFYYDTALVGFDANFRCMDAIINTSQILFGSDHPYVWPFAVAATTKGLNDYEGFSPEALKAIERENALRLFPRIR